MTNVSENKKETENKQNQLTEKQIQQIVIVKHEPSNGIAAVLNIFFPGAGSIYKGHVLMGFVWFFCVITGYAFFIVPGLLLHILCVANSFSKGLRQ